MPSGKIRSLKIGDFVMSFREAPLTMTQLAALTPPELDANISIIDESVQKLNFDNFNDVDLVGISALTGTSSRAFEIADEFKRRGKIVVLGGVHVTIFPNEAQKHADSIVVGFAETSWPELLFDFKNHKLKPRYQSPAEDSIINLPLARRDLQDNSRYAMPNTIMATRGCTNHCDFCTVPVYIKGYYKRPIEDVVAEIKTLRGKRFAFNDVSLVEDPVWTKQLLRALIPLKKKWGGLSTFIIYKDKEMMSLLQQSGCQYLLIGLESVSQIALQKIAKGFNKVNSYAEGMRVFHDHGIAIQGCFVFGFDHDTKSIFEETVEQVNRLKIDIPRFSIYTPYPGTSLYNRLEAENRILTKDFSLYDTQHVVFRPKILQPEELYSGFKWAYRETFKISSIARRTFRPAMSFPITFVGNLAYKIYVKELYRENLFESANYYSSLSSTSGYTS